MNNNLMIFEGKQVEVFEFKGEVLFNPYDVGNCLDLSGVTVRRHMQEMNEKQVIKLNNSNVQDMNFRKLHNTGENFLKEAGVYKLVFKSHKEAAERFQDWVTDEVLPQIRKTGGYIPYNENMTDEEIVARALQITTKTLEERTKQLKIAEEENLKLSGIIEEQKPRLDYLDEILNCTDAMLVTNIAFDYGLSAIALNRILCEERVQRKVRNQYILYSEYMGKGYTTTETEIYNGKPRTQTLWTQKGRMLIHQILRDRGIRPLTDRALG